MNLTRLACWPKELGIANRMTGAGFAQGHHLEPVPAGLESPIDPRRNGEERPVGGLGCGTGLLRPAGWSDLGHSGRWLSRHVAYRDDQRRTVVDLERQPCWGEGRPCPCVASPGSSRHSPRDVIDHDNLQRCNSVVASYRSGGPGSMQLNMDLLMASRLQLPYPQGYDIEQRGDMTQMMDSFQRLLWGLGVALVLMYLALVVQFASFRVPLAIMAAIPLELPGVFLALLLAHQTFSSV